MTAIKHVHPLIVFEQLLAVDGVQGRSLSDNFLVNGGGEVHCDHTACVVVATAAERLDMFARVHLIDIVQRAIRIYPLICCRIDFFTQIVVKLKK